MSERLRKIVYFDKETIKNILQEKNRGKKTSESTELKESSNGGELSADAGAQISIGMPLTARIRFAFTGKMSGKYFIQKDSSTTITSTEISDFESIRADFQKFESVKVSDIENSSTFFRVAAGYLKMVGNDVEGVNVKEFKMAMEAFEGYDVYKIDDDKYIRFNTSAFVSNYKRNDLLTTIIDVYCVPVGQFTTSDFDFLQQITRMQKLIGATNSSTYLADVFPPSKPVSHEEKEAAVEKKKENKKNTVALYDVVYACISLSEETKEK